MSKATSLQLPIVPTGLNAFIWRPLSADDIPLVEKHSRANQQADGRDSSMSAAEVGQVFALLEDKIQRNSIGALSADQNQLVAIGLVLLHPQHEEHHITLAGSVLNDYRRRGLGSYLMDWLETRARQIFAAIEDDLPRRMSTSTRSTYQDRIGLFQSRGFQANRYFSHMERNLRQIPEKALPDGLRIETWSQSHDAQLVETHNRAFADHFDFGPLSLEYWQKHVTGAEHFRGDLSCIVSAGDRIVGYLLTDVFPGRNEQRGRKEAVMEAIGVVPEFRGRGIASAMMAEVMRQYARHGIERTALTVDTENVTHALRLYEKMGFESLRTGIQFSKAVAP